MGMARVEGGGRGGGPNSLLLILGVSWDPQILKFRDPEIPICLPVSRFLRFLPLASSQLLYIWFVIRSAGPSKPSVNDTFQFGRKEKPCQGFFLKPKPGSAVAAAAGRAPGAAAELLSLPPLFRSNSNSTCHIDFNALLCCHPGVFICFCVLTYFRQE